MTLLLNFLIVVPSALVWVFSGAMLIHFLGLPRKKGEDWGIMGTMFLFDAYLLWLILIVFKGCV